ncbi:MAG: peptidoglycan DD-metalloendopeptidase family protein [Cytophagaceae bacterium]
MKSKFILLIIVLGLSISNAFAQDDPKKYKDFFQIKAPSIEYLSPDPDEILFEDDDLPPHVDDEVPVYFRPEKELSIVNEGSDFSEEDDEGELSLVEISEQLSVDSIWVTIAEYFAIWDSRSVNPYKIDGAKFSDTLRMSLYDTLNGLHWSMPLVNCPKTSEFGIRHSRWHYGIDLKLTTGDPVLASFDGIVRINRYDAGGYGNYVLIRHYNGMETLYGHLSKSNVKVGDYVRAGDIIGLGGSTGRSTGPHLHFEVRYEGNAINPEDVFDFDNHRLYDRTFELKPQQFEYLKLARQVVHHKVRPGDTLSGISKKYRVSISTICKLNGISTKSTLRVGQRLRIR